MEHITVIGAGLAGLTFIEKLTVSNPALKITLIDKNKHHFPKAEVIESPGDISKRIDLEEWAVNLGVEFIQAEVERINPNRRRIFFKKSEPREYETVVLATGLKSKKISVKGEHREGFFYLSQIDPIKLKDLLRISDEATVYVTSRLGIKLSLALVALGKEVNLVASDLGFLDKDKDETLAFLAEKKVNLYLGAVIEEAVGEGLVKAVKISPLKVFSSQLVFIDSGFIPNRDFFEQDLAIRDHFFTDYQGLYFLGGTNNQDISKEISFEASDQEARSQAEALAACIFNNG